jgi:hypothetical protein
MKLCFVELAGHRINRMITKVLRVLMMLLDGKNEEDPSATTSVIP